MPQERCVPHAIAWRGHNPYQALPEHLAQSYPSLNEHTVVYGPFWNNGISEHLRSHLAKSFPCKARRFSQSNYRMRHFAVKRAQVGIKPVDPIAADLVLRGLRKQMMADKFNLGLRIPNAH